ncbi:MAG: rRNA maturation RNase YbeY [Clostridia bacterium]|nr:rRNA maturation RNase YbeY [Clostridia bacterium]
MSLKVMISNKSGKKLPLSYNRLIRRAVSETLSAEEFTQNCEVSVSLVTEDEIKRLNNEYRKKDAVTDVLSFPMYTRDELFSEPDDERIPIGDIVICVRRAEEQAEAYGHPLERELAFLTVHSVLHLLGYDHEISPEAESEMFLRQEEVLAAMGLTRE